MSKQNRIVFLNKVYQEAFFVRRLLDSCISIEQLNNVCNFSKGLIERWNFYFDKLNKQDKKKVFDTTNTLIKSMQDNYNCRCEEFNSVKKTVIHGFCLD